MPRSLNPCSYLPRRLQVVASLSGFILFCIVFLGKSTSDPYLSNVPLGPQLQSSAQYAAQASQNLANKLPQAPNWMNPFKAPAHKPPPEQSNSTSGEIRWYSDWQWKNPFSSSVTFEEKRAVLPPLKDRSVIYTYYQAAKNEKERKAEQKILQIWRKAWWAQGFSPIILTDSEAKNNPLYRRLQGLELQREFDAEIMRWLAWGNMGTGILCNWLAMPMARTDDPVLSFLRRGEFPALTEYRGLDGAVYYGTRSHIEEALKEVIGSPTVANITSIAEGLPKGHIQQDTPKDAIAFYSKKNIDAKYKPIRELLSDEATIGNALTELSTLINSHLHGTWQNSFPKGIAVVKPLPEFTTNIVEPAIDIARNLSQCAHSPMPTSCPPNRPKCKPCSSNPIPVQVLSTFRNDSGSFTITTVPHPYTLIALTKQRDNLDPRFIRRETSRDAWILAASDSLFGKGPSSFVRLPTLKSSIASTNSTSHSLWLTAEREPGSSKIYADIDLDWLFGFTLPRGESPHHTEKASDGHVTDFEPRPDRPKNEFSGNPYGKEPSSAQLAAEKTRLARVEKSLRSSARVRDVVEAWNLADTEIWNFVRAFNARKRVERRKWEEAEEAFQGKGGIFDRWIDKVG